MGNIFQNVLQMSIYGSVAVIVVLILRKFFCRIPKRVTCLFWIIPGVRLLCPLNTGISFSVMNIAKKFGKADKTVNNIATGAILPAVSARPVAMPARHDINTTVTGSFFETLREPGTIMALIWMIGMIAMITYLAVKTLRMAKVLKSAKPSPSGRYYISDAVDTSFVLGIFRPRIYMQSGLSKREEAYILQHERMHIKNLDHITRIVGVLTVCLHWFNPLIWIAFVQMCADLEMRCDEAVIDHMGNCIKKEYCRSMVRHALARGTANHGVYAAFAGDNYSGREINMRINNLIRYKKITKIAAMFVVVFALGLTIVLSAKAQNKDEQVSANAVEKINTVETVKLEETSETAETEKVGAPVSVPGNILLDMPEEDCLKNYGKENLELPEDVVYSDEGRPYSKTYDYRDTPVLNNIATKVQKMGFEIESPDMEFLDKEGNVQTGRELYTLNTYKEEGDVIMSLNFYMVSDEYARDSFSEIHEKNGIWYDTIIGEGDPTDNWYMLRTYDPKTGLMMDASGTYLFDWEAAGLFE